MGKTISVPTEKGKTMREKLIELLWQWGVQQYIPFHTEIAMLADYLIANGVTIQKWIPVSERLPEEPGPFLIVVKSKYPFDRDYSYETDFAMYRWDGKGRLDGCWDALADWGDGEEYIHVTHWMPLPEPPKGET